MNIAFSKISGTPRYSLYTKWLENFQPITSFDCTQVSVNDAVANLSKCNGLVLTGGEDIHPGKFGKEFDISRCEIDENRDALEFALLEKALELKLPILAICRGLQLCNVYFGGTLIIDIPEDVPNSFEHRRLNDTDSIHSISVESGSLLKKISGEFDGFINSAHHQSIEHLPEKLIATAKSEDGIIEAIEFKEYLNEPFFLGVQWHPERMEYSSPFSGKIAEHFLFEVASHSLLFSKK
jgi:putative glutamine amidotransferase